MVELKVPKSCWGHWEVGRKHDKEVDDKKAEWAALHREGDHPELGCVYMRVGIGQEIPCPGNLRGIMTS